jgi:outer membrane protein assembly factor BamB
MSWTRCQSALVSLLAFLLPVSAQTVPMFRGNLQHNGEYVGPGVPSFTKIKWKFATHGQVISSPAIADGTAYVGSTDGILYAVDLETGAQKWKFATHVRITSSPAVDNEIVYFESYDGNFYALNTADGQVKWKFATAGERRFAGKHLHGSQPEGESMPDPFDFYLSSPAIWNGIVYFGSGDGNVYALDASTGTAKWKFATGNVVHASPAIADGTIFIGSWDSYFYAIDAASGKEKWRF